MRLNIEDFRPHPFSLAQSWEERPREASDLTFVTKVLRGNAKHGRLVVGRFSAGKARGHRRMSSHTSAIGVGDQCGASKRLKMPVGGRAVRDWTGLVGSLTPP